MGKAKETWENTLPIYNSERRMLKEQLDNLVFNKERQLDRVLTSFFKEMKGGKGQGI
jgi:hypothetical protein